MENENDNALPDDIRHFVTRNIDSVGHLEALLLLWRTRDRRWDPPAVARFLYVSEAVATGILKRLSCLELVEAASDGYHIRPDLTELQDQLARLAEIHSRQLVALTAIIHAKSSNRIQEFANAFKLFKEK